ncbi:hypothetical protein C4D60_Mb05t04700 [Musa balbisiana]|uniref:CDC48 N-terminal subdomain domain-containing protein n=1 Tax=Musa balbisiana TaxID=52838 RepID=A0A4S8JTR7_MUSBA|nr:hypothetical protein C4D60_Mb05t04700 [Musa balbisiana]
MRGCHPFLEGFDRVRLDFLGILEKKKSPNRLIVDEAINDDNSVGKKRRDTICIALADDTCDEPKIKMNKVVRPNLRVRLGNIVSVHQCQYVSCFRIAIHWNHLSVFGNLKKFLGVNIFSGGICLVRKGDLFLVRGGMRSIEFKVIETDPAEYCIVAADTEIFCEGEPVKREYEDRLDEVGYDDVGGGRKQMAQIRELVELPLRHPQLFKSIGVKPPKDHVKASYVSIIDVDGWAKTVLIQLLEDLVEIDIGVPDEVGCLEVLRIHTKNMKLAEDVDLERIAKDIRGYVGADLATLCTDAALQCRREKMGIIY